MRNHNDDELSLFHVVMVHISIIIAITFNIVMTTIIMITTIAPVATATVVPCITHQEAESPLSDHMHCPQLWTPLQAQPEW